jgi:5'-nucleotidase / UDP-sugar diphosphatase
MTHGMLNKSLLGAACLSVLMATPVSAYQLDIVHINDHHSHLQPNRLDLELDGQRTRVKSGGFAAVVSAFSELGAGKTNLLKLHAGDAITGDLYYTLFRGEADAKMMNRVCFDAFALGNHEFDDGDAGLAKFLDNLRSGNCKTAVLAANVKPQVGMSPLTLETETDYFAPAVILERGGERIGIIGIDIANKTRHSSNPRPDTRFLDETTTAQAEIDKLEAAGVNKIVLLTHMQYNNDMAMAKRLSGVDVIVGGDSHSLLGTAFTQVGLRPDGEYPTRVNNADGNTVCIVQAWEYSNVVGELSVQFDDAGDVTSCSGTPHLLLADSFKRKNDKNKRVELNGPARAAVHQAVSTNPVLRITQPDAASINMLARYRSQVDKLKRRKIAAASETLCLERIPGQGKSKACDKASTAANGSDITNIVAQAFLEMSRSSDVAIQNGGGVRVDILQGDVTIGDAYTLLPFANTLVELRMTGAEIIQVLEDAFDYAISDGGSTGAYPYAAGLRWTVDRSKPKGQRFVNLEARPRGAQSWFSLELNHTYKVVTNSYIARGKDGYATFGQVSKRGDALDTYLDYAQSFVEYARRKGTLHKLPRAQYSTQAYINENGARQ